MFITIYLLNQVKDVLFFKEGMEKIKIKNKEGMGAIELSILVGPSPEHPLYTWYYAGLWKCKDNEGIVCSREFVV